MKDSSFISCTSAKGSGIYVENSVVYLNNTTFQDLTAESGAAIVALNEAVLDIQNSKFMHNSVITDGVIILSESSIAIHSSILDEFIGGAITGISSTMELLDLTIQNVNSRKGISPLECIR